MISLIFKKAAKPISLSLKGWRFRECNTGHPFTGDWICHFERMANLL